MKRPRFAVADGATEAIFSRRWAELLVQSYVSRDPRTPAALRKLVESCGQQWTEEVAARRLRWSQQNKILEGSLATFVGLSLMRTETRDHQGGRWTALAVGDSCLFQVRDNELIAAFPLEGSRLFGYQPMLLSTIAARNKGIWEQSDKVWRTGLWVEGDQFFLMSDALAKWFLQEVEAERAPWYRFRQFSGWPERGQPMTSPVPGTNATQPVHGNATLQVTGAAFAAWVDEQRNARVVANDDITLLIVTIGDNDEAAAIP
jgi:hypothetical protein